MLVHDAHLQLAMDEWIKSWREYAKRHPEELPNMMWREEQYQTITEMLDQRKNMFDPMPAITCPRCRKTSYNPHDIEEKYCGFCHEFHPREG